MPTYLCFYSLDLTVAMQLENLDLKEQITTLKAQVAVHLKEANDLKAFRSGINMNFTENQLCKLKNPAKNIHWVYEDIAWAIPLHAAGPRAYNHLLRKGLPLPSASTLSRWLQRLKFHDGILKFVLNEMHAASTNMELVDRVCLIVFDEMAVAPSFEHDPLTDTVRKPARYVQMAIARGLKQSWKQPVFYAFDCKMTKSILEGLISQLENAGYPVVGIVSDMGSANRALWRELEVSTGNYKTRAVKFALL